MTRRWLWAPVAAVVAVEIPYPLVHGQTRDVLTVVTVALFAIASLTHAAAINGARGVVILLLVFGVGGFAAEAIGVRTGVPFGDYHYTGGLGRSLLHVPVVIPFAWVMMAHPAARVAAHVASGAGRVVVAAVALAGWDVFLDPQMVAAHHWQWAHRSPHLPGVASVPLTNFAGWLAVSLVLMAVLHALSRTGASRADAPAMVLWVWTWLSSTLANVAFFHRPAVAAWGAVAMGVVGVPLVRREWSR